MCFEIVCLDESKFSAIAPGVMAWIATMVMMALRVGSAIA
jgi:hypothetical protein